MLTRFLIASAVASTFALSMGQAQAAPAQEFVTITEDTFFPPVLFVQTGTEVTFHNATNQVRTARAHDGSWETGAIAPGEEVTITYSSTVYRNYEVVEDSSIDGRFINVRLDGTIEDAVGGNYDGMVVGN